MKVFFFRNTKLAMPACIEHKKLIMTRVQIVGDSCKVVKNVKNSTDKNSHKEMAQKFASK